MGSETEGSSSAVDALLRSVVVEKEYVPGVYVSVAVDGVKHKEWSCGVSDTESGTSMEAGGALIGRYYSMTKPVVSLAVLMLEEAGKLSLSDLASKHLPEWRDDKQVLTEDGTLVPAERAITLFDLMTHTSGLDYGFFPPELSKTAHLYRAKGCELPTPIFPHKDGDGEPPLERPKSLREFCERLQDIPLSHQPGERFQYSVATDVLGRVVEAVTGSTLREHLRTVLFKPLEMHDTDFVVSAAALARFAPCYTASPDAVPAYRKTTAFDIGATDGSSPWYEGNGLEALNSGGGGLVSTADDYLRFGEALRTGEYKGQRIVGEKVLQRMRQDHLSLCGARKTSLASAFQGFGLGVAVVSSTGDPATHPGAGHAGVGTVIWGGAALTMIMVDPVHNITIVMFAQLLNYPTTVPLLRYLVTKAVYEEVLGVKTADGETAKNIGFTG